ARDIEDNLKEILIRQLKLMVFEEKSVEKVADLIDVLCGLAYGKCNLPVIASKDFIQSVIVLIQSPDEFVQGSILELLLIMAENCDAEIQQLEKQVVSDHGFLQLIGIYELGKQNIYKQELYNHGVVQTLARYITNPISEKSLMHNHKRITDNLFVQCTIIMIDY
ncbi:MAG: hypothetical protein EZS28_000829, partial [Streblomastix strix]